MEYNLGICSKKDKLSKEWIPLGIALFLVIFHYLCIRSVFQNLEVFLLKPKIQKEYVVIESHKNNLKVKHIRCGNEYVVSPRKFSRIKDCPACIVQKLHDKFIKDVQEAVGQEYEVVTQYERATKTICMWHKRCKSYFYVKPSSFLKGKRCSRCNKAGVKK